MMFFFILRKKFNQVSFLHIYHHASMPLNTWFLAKWTPGGSPTMAVGINSSVHVVMYSYYLLSGLGSRWQKYLWWKKYLTGFQLVQFTFGIIQITVTIIGECPTLQQFKPLFTFYIMYVASLLLLFSKFYHEAYNKNPNGKCSTTNGVAKRKKIR